MTTSLSSSADGTSGSIKVNGVDVLTFLAGVPDYADDVAAAAGGVPIGALYRTGSTLKIRVT